MQKKILPKKYKPHIRKLNLLTTMTDLELSLDLNIDFDKASLDFKVDLKDYDIPYLKKKRVSRKLSFLRRKPLHSTVTSINPKYSSRRLAGIFSSLAGSSTSSNPSYSSNDSEELSNQTPSPLSSETQEIHHDTNFDTILKLNPNYDTEYFPNIKSVFHSNTTSPNTTLKRTPKSILKNKNSNFTMEMQEMVKCDLVKFEEFYMNFETGEITKLKENNFNLKLQQLTNYYDNNQDIY